MRVPWILGKEVDINNQLKNTIDIVFDEKEGSEFWLDYQREKKIEFRKEIKKRLKRKNITILIHKLTMIIPNHLK